MLPITTIGLWEGVILLLWFICLFYFYFLMPFLKDVIYFRQKGREEEREGEKHQCVVASWAPAIGDLTWPSTQLCALTGNWTDDPWVRRLMLNPLSHTSQGIIHILKKRKFKLRDIKNLVQDYSKGGRGKI